MGKKIRMYFYYWRFYSPIPCFCLYSVNIPKLLEIHKNINALPTIKIFKTKPTKIYL